MQIEAHDRGGCIRLHVEPIGFHCEDGEDITVWMVPLRRAWASITRRPEIRAGLHGASRQVAAGATCALWKLAHVGYDGAGTAYWRSQEWPNCVRQVR